MIGDRFNTTSIYEAIGQFHTLKQVGTVTEYIDKFEDLMGLVRRDNPSLPDEYFTYIFVSGLKEPIQHHLQCHKPTSLTYAFWYAKRLEHTTTFPRKYSAFNQVAKPNKLWTKETKPPDQTEGPTIADLRAADKCFKCKEAWVPRHAKVCKAKQNYSVIVMESANGKEEIGVVEDTVGEEEGEFFDAEQVPIMQLSTNALLGTSHPTNTFTLQVQIGTNWATALIDTGSDASFINAKFAIKHNLSTSEVPTVKVVAANGRNMFSNTSCVNCLYTIQGHSFASDLRLLEIQGYDIILGADWIFTHSPVGLNLKTREFSITKDGKDFITFADESKADQHLIINPPKMCKLLKNKVVSAVLVLNCEKLDKHTDPQPTVPPQILSLLKEYEDIFQEPKHLPPKRSVDHAITLINESKTVNQRPYRLPFHQKKCTGGVD
jgi:hypothetical protein